MSKHYHQNYSVPKLLEADDEMLTLIFPGNLPETVRADLILKNQSGETVVCSYTCDNKDLVTGECLGHTSSVLADDDFYMVADRG